MKQFSLFFATIAGIFLGLIGICWAEHLWEKGIFLYCIGLLTFIAANVLLRKETKKKTK